MKKSKRKTKKIGHTKRWKAINRKIKKNHIAFKLHTFVSQINLSWLEDFLQASRRGPRPYPLYIPLQVWLYAYSEGELRYRKVAELCKTDDYYYWLSEGIEVEEAYFEMWKLRILRRIPDLLEKYRRYLVSHDLLPTAVTAIDGTKIETWASKSQNKTEAQIDKELERLDKKLSVLCTDLTDEPKVSTALEDLTDSSTGLIQDLTDDSKVGSAQEQTDNSKPTLEGRHEKELARITRRKEKLTIRKQELQERKAEATHKTEKERDDMRINITSPDTALMQKRNGKWIQGANIQIAGNQDQVCLTHEFTSSTVDTPFIETMYDKLCTLFRMTILWFYILLDSGYMSIRMMRRFDPALGYKIIMPLQSDVAKDRKKRTTIIGGGGWRMEDGFVFDIVAKQIRCPNGYILLYKRTGRNGNNMVDIYESRESDCQSCKDRGACLGKIKYRRKKFTMKCLSPEEANFIQFSNLPEHRELYKKRRSIIEPMNSQIFHNVGVEKLHTLSGVSLRGEVALLILLHTMKKVEKLHGSYFPVPMTMDLYSRLTGFFCALTFIRFFPLFCMAWKKKGF